jgi:catechol 2,3-dioxygenase-like lactoylglutathione lyase family enzyme
VNKGVDWLKIRSLSHVGVTVTSFEKSVKWYFEKFGFRLIDEQTLSKEQVRGLNNLYGLEDANVRLGFLRAPKGGVVEIFEFSPANAKTKLEWNRPGLTHLTLDVKNVSRWYKELLESGVVFRSPPQKTGVNEWVFLEDPDGNLIELIDLKSNYFVIRILGGIAGKVMAKKKFKKYYQTK